MARFRPSAPLWPPQHVKAAALVLVTIALTCIGVSGAQAQVLPSPANPIQRRYKDGERLSYHMKGVNEAWHYEIDADGVVARDATGRFYEEYRWARMTSNGSPLALRPSSADFRQRLSLDPDQNPSAPDLSKVDPKLIGPVTDMMTFYADLWLVNKLGALRKAGDHFYFRNPAPPSSWADGSHVLVGEDAIDFDMTLLSEDAASQIAVVEIRHVPPPTSALPLKAAWMREPVGTGANNWVQIAKTDDGKFEAGVGAETFTVKITVSLADGHIVQASMENPVTSVTRICADEALTRCGEPRRKEISRHVEIAASAD